MYTFSKKLKTFSIVLMIIGILGIGYGFIAAPKTITDVEKLEAENADHSGGDESKHETSHETIIEKHVEVIAEKHDTVVAQADVATSNTDEVKDSVVVVAIEPAPSNHGEEELANSHNLAENNAQKKDVHAEHQAHLEHKLQQLQNKPWAALYVPMIFIFLLSMGVLAFYAIQQVAQAGWSPVLFRVMQGITAYLPVASVIFFAFLVLTGLHVFETNHLFAWMQEGITDPKSEHYDKIITGKSGYLNFPFWIFRAAVFLIGWNLYRYFSRKNCLAQDESSDNAFYKKNFNISAMFLVFFIVTESISSWDWIMSLDPHWSSTLFGWYVFASFFVSGITTICMITIHLKNNGYLENVNTSHIHDLAKFMFGFSVFWTYLWYSQFSLIWYANIPEEVTYFKTRIDVYTLPFWGAIVMNFVFPILILINTDFKRISWVLAMAGVVILLGHYVDFFNMIMPATVGENWFIGISEICSLLFFIGLFIFVVFTALTKSPLLPKRNPFIEESKHFHY